MTDQVTEQAAPQTIPSMTPQQAHAIKMSVLENYCRLFNQFMQKVNQYPALQHLKTLSFQDFDRATALMEKAIVNMPLNISSPQQEASAQTETSTSETNQTEIAPAA